MYVLYFYKHCSCGYRCPAAVLLGGSTHRHRSHTTHSHASSGSVRDGAPPGPRSGRARERVLSLVPASNPAARQQPARGRAGRAGRAKGRGRPLTRLTSRTAAGAGLGSSGRVSTWRGGGPRPSGAPNISFTKLWLGARWPQSAAMGRNPGEVSASSGGAALLAQSHITHATMQMREILVSSKYRYYNSDFR